MKMKFLPATMMVLVAACGGSESTGPKVAPPPPPPPPATAVASVDVTAPAEIEIGRSGTAQATPKSAAGATLAGRTVTWSSSNDAIATVSPAGVVTGAGSGSVMISATSEGRTGSATVKVDTRSAFLTAIVESVRSTYDLPAMSGAIVTRDGGVFGRAETGRRRASVSTPVGTSDLWHIGSNQKAISAHVAGIAVADGKISWTTTLADAYPALSGTMRAEYRNVTLRQLFGHLGGIIPNVSNNAVAGSGSLTAQRANIASWATSLAPTGGGVGTFTYSNTGYMIAANMVERAMGISWEDMMQTRLLAPLGITGFGWGAAPAAQNPIGQQRSGSSWTEWPGSDNPPFASASGRSHWSIDGYSTVLQDIMKADQGQSALVPQAIARVNTTSQSSQNYGSGWAISSGAWTAGGRGVSHDGSNNLNYARMQVALDRGVAVFGITNAHDTGSNRSNDAMVQLTSRLWTYYATHGN